MQNTTEQAPVQGQNEGAAKVAPVEQFTAKVAEAAKVKTEAEAREEALRSAMKVGTLHEVVMLLAIDALILGSTYAAVRSIGHRICVAYDISIDWLAHLIEGAVSAAVGVPVALLANKGISALNAGQTARGMEFLRKELLDMNQESTSRLLAKVQDDNRARNEQALVGLRGDIDAALERVDDLAAANEELGRSLGTTLGRVYTMEASVAKASEKLATATAEKLAEANATVEAAITSVGKVLDLPVAPTSPTSKKKTASKK